VFVFLLVNYLLHLKNMHSYISCLVVSAIMLCLSLLLYIFKLVSLFQCVTAGESVSVCDDMKVEIAAYFFF